MPSTATYKQHDLEPAVRTVGLKNADGSAINLTGASGVDFLLRPVGQVGAPTVLGACAVVDAANGVVQYSLATGNLDAVGVYDQDWRIKWPTNRYQTVPNTGHNTIIVEDDLTAG